MAHRPPAAPRCLEGALDTATPGVLCHRAVLRHVHDMVSHRPVVLEAFVLSQRLLLTSIVWIVLVGRRFGLDCAFLPLRNNRPDGVRTAAGLYPSSSPPLVVDCALLGRSSSRAILGGSTRAGCYLRDFLAQETCGDGCGVATGREERLTSGGSGHHNLFLPYPFHFPPP